MDYPVLESESNKNNSVSLQRSGIAYFSFAISVLWIICVTFLALMVTWLFEQGIFEGSLGIPDIRWLLVSSYGVSIILPMAIFSFVIRLPRFRSIFRTWAFSGVLAVFMALSMLLKIYQAQLMLFMQIGLLIIFLVLLLIYYKGIDGILKYPLKNMIQRNTGWTLLIFTMIIMTCPWLLWGALGSLLDTVLGIVTGFLFGVCAAVLIQSGIIHPSQRGGVKGYNHKNFLFDGFAASVILLIMSVGISQRGYQFSFAFILPVWGWCGIAFALYGRKKFGDFGNTMVLAILIGWITALPLIWLDGDELMFVISSTQGEIMGWHFLMVGVTAFIGFIIAVVLFSIQHKLKIAGNKNPILLFLIMILLVGSVLLYSFLGQPGLFGEDLFVVLEEQADLEGVEDILDAGERREEVYSRLVAHALFSQQDLREIFDRWRIPYTPYYLVNSFEVRGGPLLRLWLLSRPEVDWVLYSPQLRPLPAELPISKGEKVDLMDEDFWNLEMVGADRVWTDLQITGEGIVVGQSDSGVQGDHLELADSYRGQSEGGDYNWIDPWNHSTNPIDYGGHGTHTLGTILGNNVGVAPDATWIGCVNLARNLGNAAYYLDCMQFMLAPYPQDGDSFQDGLPAKGAHVLNNSWGCPEVEGCDDTVLLPAVIALRKAGVFVVVSAGNSGYNGCGSVDSPLAIYDQVYTVGAVDNLGEIAQFSSMGPVIVDGSNRLKPDIVAPGDYVSSAFPDNTYESASGTSMAGPHVVGVVALMWSANPTLIGNIEATEYLLNSTATAYHGFVPECVNDASYPNVAVGYGVVDAFAAVEAALNYNE